MKIVLKWLQICKIMENNPILYSSKMWRYETLIGNKLGLPEIPWNSWKCYFLWSLEKILGDFANTHFCIFQAFFIQETV